MRQWICGGGDVAIRSDAGFVLLRAGQAGKQELMFSGRCFVVGVQEIFSCRNARYFLWR